MKSIQEYLVPSIIPGGAGIERIVGSIFCCERVPLYALVCPFHQKPRFRSFLSLPPADIFAFVVFVLIWRWCVVFVLFAIACISRTYLEYLGGVLSHKMIVKEILCHAFS